MGTLIIAEAGVNHNGELEIARQLVDVASSAGADFIKFQTFNAKHLVTLNARKADYQRTTDLEESQYEMLKKVELTHEMHEQLIAHCQAKDIQFLSTGFDIENVDFLARFNLPYFKIPSGEITNLPYLRHIGRYGKPILLSTGMASLGEIETALNILEKAGTSRAMITVLHCNTEYPTPIADVNLRAMLTIRSAFDVAVGYSDHTLGIEIPIAAVAMGASVIEKHITLDRRLPGPDHQSSLEPTELEAMVTAIRNIEDALGDGLKRPSPSEFKNITVARKSIVAASSIVAGEIFTSSNLTVKRPGTGISPMQWDDVLGQRASRNFVPDELIEL